MNHQMAEQQTETISVGKECGKLILIGEHSVVYGYPAIAAPLNLFHVHTYTIPTKEPLSVQCEFYEGTVDLAPESLKGLVACIHETCKNLNISGNGIMLRIKSDIPSGRGIGSSAAVAASIVKSLYSFEGRELSHNTLMALIHVSESEIHGKPSGIDSQAVVANHAFWFRKGQPIEPLHFKQPLHLVVCDSGEVGQTKAAVMSVKKRLQADPEQIHAHLERLGKLTHCAKSCLESGNIYELGHVFNEAELELEALGVGNVKLQRMIETANRKGAVGTKLTGSGWGGCFFALARDAEHAKTLSEKMLKSGVYAAWPVMIGN